MINQLKNPRNFGYILFNETKFRETNFSYFDDLETSLSKLNHLIFEDYQNYIVKLELVYFKNYKKLFKEIFPDKTEFIDDYQQEYHKHFRKTI